MVGEGHEQSGPVGLGSWERACFTSCNNKTAVIVYSLLRWTPIDEHVFRARCWGFKG